MKYLKLFENYLESVDDRLKEVEEFLDDCFTELFDEWGFTHGSGHDIVSNNEVKVYYFHKSYRNYYLSSENKRVDCYLLICFDKNRYKHQIEDMTSDANHIFMKKVKPKYNEFAMIESSAVSAVDNLWRILIKVNVEWREDWPQSY